MKALLITMITISSWSLSYPQPPTEPQNFKDEVFDLLTELKGIDNEKYKSNFITLEEFRVFSENQDLIGEYKSMLDDIRTGKYYKEVEKYYMKIKYSAAKKGIDWSYIKFIDFIYKTKDGGLNGTMFFTYNGITYSVKIAAFLLNDGYKIASIKKFKKY